MSVLLGIGDKNLSKSFKEILLKHGFENVDETYHIDYLSEKVSYEQPEIVILHEQLQSHSVTKEDKEAEILALIEGWRMAYNDSIRVVFICIRDRNDPFLAQLIAHNVLDIFPDKRVPVKDLLVQLSSPPNFANVKRLATTKLKVELVSGDSTEEVEEETQAIEISSAEDIASEDFSTEELAPLLAEDDLTSTSPKALKEKKEKKPKGEKVAATKAAIKNIANKIPKGEPSSTDKEQTELFFDDLLDLFEPTHMQVDTTNNAVIGTVLIGVAGVKSHLGSTHTALSTARFLSKAGHSVVVVECNNSKDFDRIHTLYEGSKEMLKEDTYFEIAGVDHCKYRPNFDLNSLYAAYEYVIMDYGDLQAATHYFDEFKRAHVRLVVCSGDEWKTQWIDQFLKVNKLQKNDCTFVVPNATKAKVKDFRSQIQYDEVYPFPTQDDPYQISKDTEVLMEDLLDTYLNNATFHSIKTMKRSTVVFACLASVVITAIVFSIFTHL